MVYVIYNPTSDINDFVTDDKNSALVRAGELVDMKTHVHFEVRKYDMSIEEYNECLTADDYLKGVYTVRGFIEQFGEEPTFDTLSPAEAERLINMSPEEKAYAVMHIPDNVLLAELARRIGQYRTFADRIGEAESELRIFI